MQKSLKPPKKKPTEKKFYYITKNKAIEFEKTNYDKIVFFRGTDDHFVACDHSALIFYYLVLPKINQSLTFRKDTDNSSNRFAYGSLSIRNVEHYAQKTSELDIIEDEYTLTAERLIFTLKKPLGKEFLEELGHTEDIQREKLANAISNPDALPMTYRAIRKLNSETYLMVSRRCDAVARDYRTGKLDHLAHKAFINYINGCRDKKQFDTKMDEVAQNLIDIQIEILAIEAAGIWSMSQIHRIAYAATNALQHLKTERRKVTAWKKN